MKIYGIRSYIMKMYADYLLEFTSVDSFADYYWMNRQQSYRIIAIGSKLLNKESKS